MADDYQPISVYYFRIGFWVLHQLATISRCSLALWHCNGWYVFYMFWYSTAQLSCIGLFGPAAATALEDLPYDARGLLSGLFQQGYAVGYILASVFYRALVPTTSHGWRSLFWFGAGPPVFIIAFRLWLPETNTFQVMAAEREAQLIADKSQGTDMQVHVKSAGLKAWAKDATIALKGNWVLLCYMVVLMTGEQSNSYPTNCC